MALVSVPEEERNMELELTGHQVAKYRSIHSFHVPGFILPQHRRAKGYENHQGWRSAWGNHLRISEQITMNMVSPHAVLICCCSECMQMGIGVLLDTLGSHLNGKKR